MRHLKFVEVTEKLDPTALANAVREASNKIAAIRPTFVVSLDTPERHNDPNSSWGVSIEDVESQRTVVFWEGPASKVVHDLQEWVADVERSSRAEVPTEDDFRALIHYLEVLPPANRYKESAIYKTKDGNWNLRLTGTGATKIFRGYSVKACLSEFVKWNQPVQHAPKPDVQGFSRPTSPPPTPPSPSSSPTASSS